MRLFLPLSISCLALAGAGCDKSTRANSGTSQPEKVSPDHQANPTDRDADDLENLRRAREARRESLKDDTARPSAESRDEEISEGIGDPWNGDPALAAAALSKMPQGTDGRNRLIGQLAAAMASEDPAKAREWAATLETPEEQSLAFSRIAMVMAEESPEAAANLISEKAVAGRPAEVAIVQIAQRWTLRSPEDAVNWVCQFPPGEMRSAGLKASSSAWLETDSEAPLAWIASIADDSLRIEAGTAYAEALIGQPEDIQQALVAKAPAEVKTAFEILKSKEAAELDRDEDLTPDTPAGE